MPEISFSGIFDSKLISADFGDFALSSDNDRRADRSISFQMPETGGASESPRPCAAPVRFGDGKVASPDSSALFDSVPEGTPLGAPPSSTLKSSLAKQAFAAAVESAPTYPAPMKEVVLQLEDIEVQLQAIRRQVVAKASSKQSGNGAMHVKNREELNMQIERLQATALSKSSALLADYEGCVLSMRSLVAQRSTVFDISENALFSKLAKLVERVNFVLRRIISKHGEDAQGATGLYMQRTTKKEKLPEHAKSTLRAWLENHFEHPYPTPEEKQELITKTGLSMRQINQW